MVEMKTYTVTTKVQGYITKQVKARSKKEAVEKGEDIDWKMELGHLEDKSSQTTVEKDED